MNECLFKLFCKKENIVEIIIVLHKELLSRFVPVRIKAKNVTNNRFRSYNMRTVEKLIINEMASGDGELYMYNDMNCFHVLSYKNDIVLLSFIMKSDIVDDNWIQLLEDSFKCAGIVGFEHSLDDNLEQNEEYVSNIVAEGWSLDNKRFKSGKIDTEYNPGHAHVENGIWFGSCYRMWFGKEYYQYISKETLQSFKNCYENCELENEVVRITLYEDMWGYANPVNREIQWDFRKRVGMDTVAHELKAHPRVQNDPEIEIFTGEYEHGGVRLIYQYFDGKGNRVSKSKAKFRKCAEYSIDGKILFQEEQEFKS